MPNPPSSAIQQLTALVRQRLPWLMLVVGMLLAWTMLGHSLPATTSASSAEAQVLISPDRGHPDDLPDLVAIAESGAESSRSARQRPVDSHVPPTAPVAAPAGMFVAAATDTLLQHAVERSHRYPPALYLLLNPGHAPPLA
ncbi:hypothetical protein [Stenotrophomonas sp. Iso1]|uniref:hypothetical protein n=1 Tax=Stenotrophomonas sp. Iso1 TaxID=2977283 RepID=UPI0022B7C560|nr:hypothetical protein [Stenotrophomonas sp. Iso1]